MLNPLRPSQGNSKLSFTGLSRAGVASKNGEAPAGGKVILDLREWTPNSECSIILLNSRGEPVTEPTTETIKSDGTLRCVYWLDDDLLPGTYKIKLTGAYDGDESRSPEWVTIKVTPREETSDAAQ